MSPTLAGRMMDANNVVMQALCKTDVHRAIDEAAEYAPSAAEMETKRRLGESVSNPPPAIARAARTIEQLRIENMELSRRLDHASAALSFAADITSGPRLAAELSAAAEGCWRGFQHMTICEGYVQRNGEDVQCDMPNDRDALDCIACGHQLRPMTREERGEARADSKEN